MHQLAKVLTVAIMLVIVAGFSFVLGQDAEPVRAQSAGAIVNGLGSWSPGTILNCSSSSGQLLNGTQIVGPRFVLAQSTQLTEIGGFLDKFVPFSPTPRPLTVQIRAATAGGVPGGTVVASYELSDHHPYPSDSTTLFFYESAAINLTLPAGTYFALFAPQGDESGTLLSACDGINAGSLPLGILNPSNGSASAETNRAAARVLGIPLAASATATATPLTTTPTATPIIVAISVKPGSSSPKPINLGAQGDVPVAILSSANFDARTVDPSTVTLANAAVAIRGKGTSMASFEDVNADRLPDLVLHISTDALVLTDQDTQVLLEGRTFGGASIRGTDTVRVIRPATATPTATTTPTATATVGPNAKMYWADTAQAPNEVSVANLDGSGRQGLLPPTAFFSTSLALDQVHGKMYWIRDGIYRASLDGAGVEQLSPANAFGLTIDVSGGKLYYAGACGACAGDAIFRANLDGSNGVRLVSGANVRAHNVRLDPSNNKMYWTSSENDVLDSLTGIYRANLDGTQVERIIATTERPDAIDLDLVNRKMYWTHNGSYGPADIKKANLDGAASAIQASIETVVSGVGETSLALDVARGKIYLASGQQILRVSLDGSNLETLVATDVFFPSIALAH